jgi:hypothetical protein
MALGKIQSIIGIFRRQVRETKGIKRNLINLGRGGRSRRRCDGMGKNPVQGFKTIGISLEFGEASALTNGVPIFLAKEATTRALKNGMEKDGIILVRSKGSKIRIWRRKITAKSTESKAIERTRA